MERLFLGVKNKGVLLILPTETLDVDSELLTFFLIKKKNWKNWKKVTGKDYVHVKWPIWGRSSFLLLSFGGNDMDALLIRI